jgi:hypothetical protein
MNAWAGLGSEELTLDDVWPAVAASGVQGLALVLPVPGDPLGLVSTGAFAREALAAEVGVVLVTEQLRIGWVPEPDLRGSSYRGVRWRVYAEPLGDGVAPGALPGDAAATGADDPNRIVEQADRALSRSLRAATDALAGLDLATWRPEVAAGRTEAEAALHAAAQLMPPAWPLPARALAERALALWRVVQIARADPGAASASGSLARAETLGMLSHAVREAAMAAYNVPASTMTRAATRGTRGHTQPESARHRPT